MARRDCILALAVGLCAPALPGCIHLFENHNPPVQPAADHQQNGGPPTAEATPPIPDKTLEPLAPDEARLHYPPLAPNLDQSPAADPPPLPAVLPAPEQPSSHDVVAQPVKESKPTEDPLVAALRCFMNKEPAEAMKHLEGYDKANQEILLRLLPLIAGMTEQNLDEASQPERAALLEQVESLAALLRPRAPLFIDKMAICRDIKGFGRYEPIPEDRYAFRAGSDDRPGDPLWVYVEVRNPASVPEGASYVTHLDSSVEIRDYSGKIVWKQPLPGADHSRTPRHDYYITYSLSVPPHIPPGSYTLWIQVEDTLTQPHRFARKSLDFTVLPSGCVRGAGPDLEADATPPHEAAGR